MVDKMKHLVKQRSDLRYAETDESSPLKIVYLNPAANLGGGELSLLDLISSTRDAVPGAELHLVVTAPGPLTGKAEALNVRVHVLQMPQVLVGLGDSALRGQSWPAMALALGSKVPAASLNALRYARDLRSLIRDVGPTLVHSNGIKAHLLLRLASSPGVPVVWHIRDMLGTRPLVARLLRLAANRGVAGAIAVSEAVARDARSVIGRGFPIEAIYDGIDVDRFAPGIGDGAGLDELAGLPPAELGTVRVGLVATYARWKGHEVFLDALARLDPTVGPPVRGYIVGGAIYQTRGSQFSEAELRARVASLGLGCRVGFVPFQAETSNVYRSLDVVVHASTLPEPFGRTIIEAMACGRPTIVAKAGGAAELFDDDRDALGVHPGDPAVLANAIRRLVADPGLRRTIAEQARRSAVERFDRRRLGLEVIAAYKRLGISVRDNIPM
jgi:glycosyltransferase involved in cell wall biosynthesis